MQANNKSSSNSLPFVIVAALASIVLLGAALFYFDAFGMRSSMFPA